MEAAAGWSQAAPSAGQFRGSLLGAARTRSGRFGPDRGVPLARLRPTEPPGIGRRPCGGSGLGGGRGSSAERGQRAPDDGRGGRQDRHEYLQVERARQDRPVTTLSAPQKPQVTRRPSACSVRPASSSSGLRMAAAKSRSAPTGPIRNTSPSVRERSHAGHGHSAAAAGEAGSRPSPGRVAPRSGTRGRQPPRARRRRGSPPGGRRGDPRRPERVRRRTPDTRGPAPRRPARAAARRGSHSPRSGRRRSYRSASTPPVRRQVVRSGGSRAGGVDAGPACLLAPRVLSECPGVVRVESRDSTAGNGRRRGQMALWGRVSPQPLLPTPAGSRCAWRTMPASPGGRGRIRTVSPRGGRTATVRRHAACTFHPSVRGGEPSRAR